MRPSRGMGKISPAKIKTIRKKDGDAPVTVYKDGGAVWDKPRPKKLGAPKALTPASKSKAKSMAKAAGRPYPNLVDNMRAAKGK